MAKTIRLVAVEDLGTSLEVKDGKVESKATASGGGVTALALNKETKTLTVTSGTKEVSVDLSPVAGSTVTLDPKEGNLLASGEKGLVVDPTTVATLITNTVKNMGLQLVDSKGDRVTLNKVPLSVALPEVAAATGDKATEAAKPASGEAATGDAKPAAATGGDAKPAEANAQPAAQGGNAATPAANNTPAAATGEQATPAANGAQATPAQPAATPAA